MVTTSRARHYKSSPPTLFEVGEIIEGILEAKIYTDIDCNWILAEARHTQMEIDAEYEKLRQLCKGVRADSPEHNRIREFYPNFEPDSDHEKHQSARDATPIPGPLPELAPEIYSTNKLVNLVHMHESSIRRYALKAAENGTLPREIPEIPGWFVVGKSNRNGGQGRGWQFKESCKSQMKRLNSVKQPVH